MKKLLTVLTILILGVPVLAGGPSPDASDWEIRQQIYSEYSAQQRLDYLNHDFEVANLMNEIYDLNVYNAELIERNDYLESDVSTEYIETVKEKPVIDWWYVLGGIVTGYAINQVMRRNYGFIRNFGRDGFKRTR